MPSQTALPPPAIEWPYRAQWPGPYPNRRSREGFRGIDDPQRLAGLPAPAGPVTIGNAVTGVGQGESGTGAGTTYDIRDHVPCWRTTTGPQSVGWTWPWWLAVFDGTLLPAGFRIPEGGVVAVVDCALRWGISATADQPDMGGVWLGGGLDASSAANYRNQTPGGLSPGADTGGAGLMLRDDGTGYDYLAWAPSGGAITERVAVPISSMIDTWHVIRFILRTALPGGFASLSIDVDGVRTIERTYGTPELQAPTAPLNTAFTGKPVVPAIAFTGVSAGASFDWAYAWEGKWGRFLPSGQEVQGQ